jgi:hypothetical protein
MLVCFSADEILLSELSGKVLVSPVPEFDVIFVSTVVEFAECSVDTVESTFEVMMSGLAAAADVGVAGVTLGVELGEGLVVVPACVGTVGVAIACTGDRAVGRSNAPPYQAVHEDHAESKIVISGVTAMSGAYGPVMEQMEVQELGSSNDHIVADA